jgi:hypothetical protein
MTPSWVIPLTPLNLAALALLAIYIIGSWIMLITAYYRLKWISVLEEYIRDLEGRGTV